jgi:hypothetical protein
MTFQPQLAPKRKPIGYEERDHKPSYFHSFRAVPVSA